MNRRSFCRLTFAAFVELFLFGCARDQAMIRYRKEIEIPEWPVREPTAALVVFDSWSGNTQMIGKAIAKVLDCPAVHLADLEDGPVPPHDLLVIGSPVHGGMTTDRIKEFLSRIEPPRLSAVFATFGAPLFGPLTANMCLNDMEKRLYDTCIGRFKCHGFHQILRTYPSHPDEEDQRDAARFAAGMLERCRTSGSAKICPKTEKSAA